MIRTPEIAKTEIAAKNEKQATIDGGAVKNLLIVKNKKKSTWSLLRKADSRIQGWRSHGRIPVNCSFHRERLNQSEEKIVEESVSEVAQGNIRC